MRILYISEIYPDVKRGFGVWGGGEKQFYEISKRIVNYGHSSMVLTCRFPGQPATEIVNGVHIQRVGLSREPKSGGARRTVLPVFGYLLETTKEAIKLNPDLIHCNTYFPAYAGIVAARVKGIPLVSTFHDIYGLKGWIESQHSFGWGLAGHLATTLAASLPHSQIIAVSPQCKKKLTSLGVSERKISTVPNGVDLRLFDSIKVEKIPNQVLFVGRLVNFKHVEWLIQAFSHVLKAVPTAKLKIVGGGPERASLEKNAEKLGIRAHVTFTGVTKSYDDVATFFKESAVFVLPSTVEGEAIVLKEAMASCLPVIAINVYGSGVLSLVRDGENGFLLEPGNIHSIAEKITKLLLDRNMAKTMGEKGMRFARQFDWEEITKQTLRVYEETLDCSHRGV